MEKVYNTFQLYCLSRSTSPKLGHKTERRNHTCLRAKNSNPIKPVLPVFSYFKERLTPLK